MVKFFQYCENQTTRQYDKFHESNILNTAALIRFCSTLLLIALVIRNKRRAARSYGMAARFVILPSYFDYIGALCLTYFLFGIFNGTGGTLRTSPFVLALQRGIYRMLDEGLAFFLMQHGAGYNGMRTAALYGTLWGLLLFVAYFIVYNKDEDRGGGDLDKVAFIGNLVIVLVVLLFYCIIVLTPLHLVHKRPAIFPFALFQILNMISWILIFCTRYAEYDVGYCLMFFTRTALEGAVEPVIVFYTLILDSEFWQGLGSLQDIKNPLAGVWDLHLDTAAAMGKQLSDMEQSSRRLPIIHFGLLELDEHLGYVAGGLSRVYFGRMRKEMVAVKILFAMELTPRVVEAFYEEVQVLYQLQHENVVRCLGVSVMPPAVCVVLEYCQFGSLFDYLYKFPKLSAANLAVKRRRVLSSSGPSDVARMTELSALSGNIREADVTRASVSQDDTSSEITGEPRDTSVGNPVLIRAAEFPDEAPKDPLSAEEEMSPVRPSRTSSVGESGERTSISYNDRIKVLLEAGGGHLSQDMTFWGRLSLPNDKRRQSFLAEQTVGRPSAVMSDSPFRSIGSHVRRTLTSRPPNDVLPPVGRSEPKPSFSLCEKLDMIIDACRGLEFLHVNGYMHCDIKSPNFLVSNNKVVKVADLGEARDYTLCLPGAKLPNPSVNWSPPEMLIPDVSLRSYTVASDVYGLAMVISEILLQEVPMDIMFRNSSPEQSYHHLVAENRRPVLPDWVPSALREVVARAWATDPALRPSCGKIAEVAIDCVVKLQNEEA